MKGQESVFKRAETGTRTCTQGAMDAREIAYGK